MRPRFSGGLPAKRAAASACAGQYPGANARGSGGAVATDGAGARRDPRLGAKFHPGNIGQAVTTSERSGERFWRSRLHLRSRRYRTLRKCPASAKLAGSNVDASWRRSHHGLSPSRLLGTPYPGLPLRFPMPPGARSCDAASKPRSNANFTRSTMPSCGQLLSSNRESLWFPYALTRGRRESRTAEAARSLKYRTWINLR